MNHDKNYRLNTQDYWINGIDPKINQSKIKINSNNTLTLFGWSSENGIKSDVCAGKLFNIANTFSKTKID